MKKGIIVAILLGVGIHFLQYITINYFDPVPAIYIIVTTSPPHEYMVKDLEEQAECAKKAGFVFKFPRLRVMKSGYAGYGWKGLKGFAYMHPSINTIVLAPWASYETIAHELGHIIDGQMRRKGHPLFEKIKDYPPQEFADAVKEVILNECRVQ